jgi:hypothetical protein
MTPQDMLREIVEKMVEKWNPYKDSSVKGLSINRYEVYEDEVLFYAYDKSVNEEPAEYPFARLILTPAAMGALFGEEDVCSKCGSSNYKSTTVSCAKCVDCSGSCFLPAHLFHTLEAVKRIYDKSADAAIDYLWEAIG